MQDLNTQNSPFFQYQQALENKTILPDPAQYQAVLILNKIYLDLVNPKKFNLFKPKPMGLYMFGGVGRGKTYLMDLFFNSLNFNNKLRLHFYRFMALIHEKLNQQKLNQQKLKNIKIKQDPLEIIAQELAQEFKIICLDEFMVEDIADAMILGELLKNLFKNKVILITTSNTHPDNLYLGGIQRDRFLESIIILKNNLKIISVDSQKDYRELLPQLACQFSQKISHDLSQKYLSPQSPGYLPGKDYEYSWMQAHFEKLVKKGELGLIKNQKIIVCQRELACVLQADKIIWFEFKVLCGLGRGAADYIELADLYTHILLSDLSPMDDSMDDYARRFVSLIDELYDRQIKLIISANCEILQIYTGSRLNNIFERTRSRLIEMQGWE